MRGTFRRHDDSVTQFWGTRIDRVRVIAVVCIANVVWADRRQLTRSGVSKPIAVTVQIPWNRIDGGGFIDKAVAIVVDTVLTDFIGVGVDRRVNVIAVTTTRLYPDSTSQISTNDDSSPNPSSS